MWCWVSSRTALLLVQSSSLTSASLPDTNVLLRHLQLLQELVTLMQHPQPQSPPTILIPHIVIAELDGLKNSDRIADSHDSRSRASIAVLARRATSWILDAITEEQEGRPTVVRGQRRDETLVERDRNGRQLAENNDALVLDAGLYHLREGKPVVLLTDDKNLCLRARIEGLVDAFGIEEGTSALKLLERLDPPFARSMSEKMEDKSGSSNGRSSTSPTRPRQTIADPSSPSRRRPPPDRASSVHSPPPRHSPPIPRSTSVPIPLASSRAIDDSMELEAPAPPPIANTPYAPTLKPILSPSDVFFNLQEVLISFVAARLYRHVFEQLLETRPREQHRWQEELGDYRLWEARDCVKVMKAHWEDGRVRDVCLRGLEREPSTSSPSSSRVDKQPPTSVPTSPPAPTRGTHSSRWAVSASIPTRRAPSPPPIPRPPPRATSNRPRLSSTKRLSALHSSLSILHTSLCTPARDTNSWSPPRWEVLIEGIGELLIALLGGWFEGDVEKEVRIVVEEWASQLRAVRVDVRLDDIGL